MDLDLNEKSIFEGGGAVGGVWSVGGDDDTLDGRQSVHPEMMGKNGAGESSLGVSLDFVCATRRDE